MRKRFLSFALILLLLNSFCLSVSAHEAVDMDRRGSITISMTYQGKPVLDGILMLFRVADVQTDNGDYFFVYNDDFDGCSIPVTELSSANLPVELAQIARFGRVQGLTRPVRPDGKVVFSDLEVGLYLVVQTEAASGFKKINPFLVSVPYNEDGHYIYDVTTTPKNLPGLETEPTETTKPSGSKLPQTGQMNWPVPVLASAGMLLIAAGLCLRNSGKRKTDEA